MTDTMTMHRERPPGSAPLSLGAYAVSAGLWICMFGDSEVGGFITLCGILLTLLGVHRLGRSGPDRLAVTKTSWVKTTPSGEDPPTPHVD